MWKLLLPVAAVALLAGCSAPGMPTLAESEGPPAASAEPNVDACLFVAGGSYEDAVDLFLDFTDDPASVTVDDIDPVVERFDTASSSASGDMLTGLQDAGGELNAMRDRVAGGGIDVAIDYQLLADALEDIGDSCSAG